MKINQIIKISVNTHTSLVILLKSNNHVIYYYDIDTGGSKMYSLIYFIFVEMTPHLHADLLLPRIKKCKVVVTMSIFYARTVSNEIFFLSRVEFQNHRSN